MARVMNILIVSLVALAPLAGTAHAAPSLSLDEILGRAMKNNSNIKAADLEVAVREAEESSVRARMLPMLRVESNVFLWDDEQVFERFSNELGPLFQGMVPAGQTPPSLDLQIRDQFIFTVQAAIVEPLGKLYQIYQGQAAKALMTEAAELDAIAARRKLQEQVVESYFNHISAARMSKTVEAALKQVEAFEKMTNQYLTAGLVEKDALLKVQVQRAELEKGQIQANKGVALTKAMLNMLMGQPLETDFGITCLAAMTCEQEATSTVTQSLAEMQDEAVTGRPELRSGRKQKQAAARGSKAAFAALFPDVNLIVAYQHNYGTGEMMPENAVFGGVAIEWNLFEWGATKYQWDAAQAKHAKAAAVIQAAEEGIRLQVHQKRLELEEAEAQAEVTKAEVALAEENLRLERARYEVQNTTATDLLQAQTSVVKTKNEQIVATMKVRAAVRNLKLALGRDLLEESQSTK